MSMSPLGLSIVNFALIPYVVSLLARDANMFGKKRVKFLFRYYYKGVQLVSDKLYKKFHIKYVKNHVHCKTNSF